MFWVEIVGDKFCGVFWVPEAVKLSVSLTVNRWFFGGGKISVAN